jgi:hypothetical protein
MMVWKEFGKIGAWPVDITSRNLPAGTEENHEKHHSG